MSKSLEKLMCDSLLDILKSLSNLSSVRDCSGLENIPLSNASNTICLPLRSVIALVNVFILWSCLDFKIFNILCQMVLFSVWYVHINDVVCSFMTKSTHCFEFSKIIRFNMSPINNFTSISFFSFIFKSF